MKKPFIIIALLFCSVLVKAQDNLMRDNGKIYVVIAVMLTILAGLILYLVRLDRKISKLEKNK